ncbi:MAG TPA: hypothetical protein VLT59_05910 [Steroidobacteraceae bacterium]|nr:hypothetical protein [Steroidobacteraceae bacterium]
MNEGLFKTPEEAALDEVTAHATELLELWHSLEDDPLIETLRARVGDVPTQLEAHLDNLMRLRQARGQLPAMGNIERTQFGAVAAKLEALLPGVSEEELAAEKLGAAASELASAIDAGLTHVGDASITRSLEEMRADIGRLRASLQAR